MPVGRGGGTLLTPPPLPKGILFSLRSHGKIVDCEQSRANLENR